MKKMIVVWAGWEPGPGLWVRSPTSFCYLGWTRKPTYSLWPRYESALIVKYW